jgi:hypothetical protein
MPDSIVGGLDVLGKLEEAAKRISLWRAATSFDAGGPCVCRMRATGHPHTTAVGATPWTSSTG